MSVSSQENQSQDFQVDQAIAEGRRQAKEVEPELEITLEFTDSEQKMLNELAKALALSVKVLLESAISYVYFYREDKNLLKKIEEYSKYPNQDNKEAGESTDKIEESPKRSNSYTKKLALAVETSHKLEKLGMKDKTNECVIIGIDLLYERLIKSEQKSANA
jgi:activator of 2-hydroxyglutaryl-CoA dehydratase